MAASISSGTCSSTEPSSALTSQADEITSIKKNHPGRCRVITNDDHSYNITIQPENMDATIKFRITESYPGVVPAISVRSSSLDEDSLQDLTRMLKKKSQEMLNTFMIQELTSAAETWLRSNGMRAGKVSKQTSEEIIDTPTRKPRKPKKKKKIKEDDIQEKKPAMKTAEDVIKRILWDDNLDRDDFVIGYLDRFRGVVEKYFSAFSWEDIASVDYTVLAIPKHRIQYFKYRVVKIWDKAERLDNVFGSTGSNMTITDVIAKYKEDVVEEEKKRGGQDVGVSAGNQKQNYIYENEDEDSDDDDDDDDDNDGDDGITVTVDSNTKSDKYHADSDDDDDVDEAFFQAQNTPSWKDKLRPNHFLAMRITDEEIRNRVGEVHDFILDHEPLYSTCVVPPTALHVTLCTLGLDTPEQISNAVSTLQDMMPELSKLLPQEALTFQNVSHFYNRVLYSEIQCPKEFLDFVHHLKLCLRQAGIDIRDGFEFMPHMTLMKTTRSVSRQKRSKYIDPWLYQGYSDMYFGKQKLQSINLCSMRTERDEDGFYISVKQFDFHELQY